MSVPPNVPIVNLGYREIDGGVLSTTATNTAISIASGQFRNSTDVNDIVLPAAVTVNGANLGLNGLDTGVLAASTFYAVYAIASSINGGNPTNNNFQPAGGLLSLNITQPLLPVGYDMYRRIGYVLTDGAVHILPFVQTGRGRNRTMWYDASIAVLVATAGAAFAALNIGAAVPLLATSVTFRATLIPNAAGNFVALRPTGSASVVGYTKMSGDVAAVAHIDDITCPCNATPSIDWVTDAASTVALAVTSYLDEL